MKYFSMFSGIGGFEYGIEQAEENSRDVERQTSRGNLSSGRDSSSSEMPEWGLQYPMCVGYSEIDKYALAIYKAHYPNHTNYGDANEIDTDTLPSFDLLVGGFPCQSFSIAGKRRGFEDTRGTLFFEIARLLSEKRPRYFILENVKGLLSHDKGETFETMLRILTDIGYEYQWQVLNSKDFGVPQNRERVFIIGHIRGERRPEVFPIGENVGEDIEPDEQRDSEVCPTIRVTHYKSGDNQPVICDSGLHRKNQYRDTVAPLRANTGAAHNNKIIQRPHGYNKGGGKELPCLRGSAQQQNDFLHTVTGGLQDHAVTMIDKSTALTEAMGQGGGHTPIVDSIRRLTPIECERLQAFPDDWTEYGLAEDDNLIEISDTQRYKCLGNAVTTSVVEAVMTQLMYCIPNP